jgi:hypothetical protein
MARHSPLRRFFPNRSLDFANDPSVVGYTSMQDNGALTVFRPQNGFGQNVVKRQFMETGL